MLCAAILAVFTIDRVMTFVHLSQGVRGLTLFGGSGVNELRTKRLWNILLYNTYNWNGMIAMGRKILIFPYLSRAFIENGSRRRISSTRVMGSWFSSRLKRAIIMDGLLTWHVRSVFESTFWSRSFIASLWTSPASRSINLQKKLFGQCFSNTDLTLV